MQDYAALETYTDGSSEEEWALFVEWLGARGPDEWHGFVSEWNWDYGSRIVMWVLRQPACDRATAILSFWLSGVDDIFTDLRTYRDYYSPEPDDRVRFGTEILYRWRAGFYERGEILLNKRDRKFVDDARTSFERKASAFETSSLIWQLPLDFAPLEEGRSVPGYFAWEIASEEAIAEYQSKNEQMHRLP